MSQQFIIDERLSTIQSAALPFKEQTQKLIIDTDINCVSTITPPPPKGNSKPRFVLPRKIDSKIIDNLESKLTKIRFNPSSIKDILYTYQIDDGEVSLCNKEGDISKYMTSCAQYGLSKQRSNALYYIHPHLLEKNGEKYGQDYCITTRDTSILSDGHGTQSERLSQYISEKLYEGINNLNISDLLLNNKFKEIQILIKNMFSDINDKLQNIYTDRKHSELSETLSINRIAGTTANISKIFSIQTGNGKCKRYIVSANVGDSETGLILRDKNAYKIFTLSGFHNAENISEAERMLKSDPDKYNKLFPIYGRFGSTNTLGEDVCPLPSIIQKHLDGKYMSQKMFPIFCNRDNKLVYDKELQHKMLFGTREYGRLYNILDWCGGIQSLRCFVLEKEVNGKWEAFMPIPRIDYLNMGSSMRGNNQCSRGYEGTDMFNDYDPHISIIEIPPESHATLVTCSDGYGDTVFWSQIAEAICKSKYGSDSNINANIIKSDLIDLMNKNIINKDIQGYSVIKNVYGGINSSWDDVSFSIIDSPPLI